MQSEASRLQFLDGPFSVLQFVVSASDAPFHPFLLLGHH